MKNFAFILLIGFAMLLSCCKPCEDPTNPECKNYDPCYRLSPVSAEFEMFESIYNIPDFNFYHDAKVVTGTHLSINPLKLIALDSSELDHQWIIGTDPRIREGANEVVNFVGYVGPLTITHIVSGEPNRGCFPDDDGIDTVTKTIEILPYVTNALFLEDGDLPIYGTFRGYHTHLPNKTFDITIVLDTPVFIGRSKFIKIINFPEGCPGLHEIKGGANGFGIDGSGWLDYDACWGTYAGRASLRDNGDSLIIHHRFKDPDSLALNPPKYIERKTTFLGKRQ